MVKSRFYKNLFGELEASGILTQLNLFGLFYKIMFVLQKTNAMEVYGTRVNLLLEKIDQNFI